MAVICGLQSEARAVSAALGDRTVRIEISGADAARAEALAQSACAAGAAAVMSVGVSGGLDPALAPGDLVLGDAVVSDDSGEIFAVDGFLHGALRENLPSARVGRLFGADAIVATPDRKRTLFENWRAIAVDMESHGAARAAAGAGVPFLAIRAIADPADRALPPAALGAVAPDGSTRVVPTLLAAMARPGQFPALMQLGSDSKKAHAALARALPECFALLDKALAA